jgi:adenosylcobinamide-GDP ribazoletransferase
VATVAAAAAVGAGPYGAAWALAVAVVGGLAAALALIARAVRRLSGITGDVLGGAAEIATTAVLLVAALAYANSLTW